MHYNNYVKINTDAFVGAEPELVLKTVFGYDSFRSNQKEIINEVLKGHDTLAIMPTGGGKSICYQVPALILPGITIVVSPLISLMQDQVNGLEAAGIHSVFLNSSLDWPTYQKSVEEIKNGRVKIVYVSPEGLNTSRVRDILSDSALNVSCITVDEAHCVSQWGHDFRQDYLEIGSIRRYFSGAVMIALTATATAQVRSDITKNLLMKKPAMFISSFDRPNIYLEVQPKRNGLEQIITYIRRHAGDSGIIYCFSRRQVDELTETLDNLGYSVLKYHAGLSDEERAKNQDLFVKDQVQIMVATIAFGMGIDKPNVRYVINYDLPKSVEEFYQQIGRAGRDGLPAASLLLYSSGDLQKIRFFFNEAADPEKAEKLLQGMVSFAAARTCRRQALLSYFGESFEPSGDAECCCDICSATGGKGALPLTDVTIPVQKLLCCIIRTKERFGATYVIDVLLGSRNKRILENNHNMLSTWGIGTELTKEDWLELVDLLIGKGYLIKAGDYSILTITSEGRGLLATREKILLPFVITGRGSALAKKKQIFGAGGGAGAYGGSGAGNGTGGAGNGNGAAAYTGSGAAAYDDSVKITRKKGGNLIVAEKPSADDEAAEKIIETLKNWRRRKADDMNVPPYIIFGDKTLLDLAAKKPESKKELLNVYGIGQAKAEEFGKAIIQIISDSISS